MALCSACYQDAPFSPTRSNACKKLADPHAPQSAIRDHLNKPDQARPFRISPGSALRAPPVGCTSGGPHGSCAISPQSRYTAVSGGISRHPDCGEIAQLPCGPLEVQLTDGACVVLPGDIRSGRACSDSLIWSQMALSGACYDQGAGAPATRCAVGRSGVPRECMASHARQWASHACSPSRGTTGCL